MSTLQQMAERVALAATQHFPRAGELGPAFLCENDKGEPVLIPRPQFDNKDLVMGLVKMMFADAHVVRYVSVTEGWLLVKPPGYQADSEPSPQHHPDRIECVLITGEAHDEPTLLGYAKIVRPEGRGPYLEKFKWERSEAVSSGRMFNLLSAPVGKPLN